MTDTERIAEINAELALIKETKNAILYGGQEYDIDSGSSKRMVKNADYNSLIKREKELRAELSDLEGTSGINVSPGW